MVRVFFLLAAFVVGAWLSTSPEAGTQTTSAARVQYARDILPILSANCLLCHGPDEKARKAGLRLDDPTSATRPLRSGSRAVVPHDPKNSELAARIFSTGDDRMPPHKSQKELKETEKQLLRRWIEEGAAYQSHWAFVPPKKPSPPSVLQPGRVRNPIDLFIQARLARENLQPSTEADRYTLARRVSIDLTGLPPSLTEVDRFTADTAPDAYERYVDRVLQSPAFGERWAQMWLDLARYADSNGYAEDQPRTIWKFRDWVIKAFNDNMPFDQFTVEQLAADLLPNPTPEQLLATAFHRNTLTNTEGGTNDEEFRNIAVVDRVNTTFQVWMSLTMNCAQCHSHKYDPISQEEYFRVFAIFNQTEDSDKPDNSPNLPYLPPAEAKQKAILDAELAELTKQLTELYPNLDKVQQQWEKQALQGPLPANIKTILTAGKRPSKNQELENYFRAGIPAIQHLHRPMLRVKAELAKLPPVPTPIMKELPEGKKRVTKIHVRGDWLNQGAEVKPGIPAVFYSSEGMPADRLSLAKWLVDPRNPLTARVAVNRFWEQIFGTGLVDTPEDFGLRSNWPRHPELLDWLAVEFQHTLKWDVKKVLKLMVTSATYRQSSKVSPELAERDPDNRLFGRGPRFRSSAETIRDQALYVSGLLSPKMYGPSVRPLQPKFGLNAAFGPGTDWATSAGEDKYRRGLYTYWRRTTPYPSMVTFDAPSRTVCAVNRPRTNTPLQALVTLNDPCFVEAAQALARRIVKEAGPTVEERVRFAFHACLIRPPEESEVRRLADLFEKARTEYAGNPKEAEKLATDPLGPLAAGTDAVELAAWTVVSNVLLNLDEMFAKR